MKFAFDQTKMLIILGCAVKSTQVGKPFEGPFGDYITDFFGEGQNVEIEKGYLGIEGKPKARQD